MRMKGVAVYFVFLVAGQLVMSVVSDSTGMFGNRVPHSSSPIGITGVVIAFIGAVIVALKRQWDQVHASPPQTAKPETPPPSTQITMGSTEQPDKSQHSPQPKDNSLQPPSAVTIPPQIDGSPVEGDDRAAPTMGKDGPSSSPSPPLLGPSNRYVRSSQSDLIANET